MSEITGFKRIVNMTFRIAGAQDQSGEVKEMAQMYHNVVGIMNIVQLAAFGLGFSFKGDYLVGGAYTVKKMEYAVSDEIMDYYAEEIRAIYAKYGAFMLMLAKILCPIVTGRLAMSLRAEPTDDGVALMSDCPYYWVQEARMHFVGTAVDFYEPIMIAEIDAFIAAKQMEFEEAG